MNIFLSMSSKLAMELPENCIKHKRELLSLLNDILKHLPDDSDHADIRRRTLRFTQGMCPKFPIEVVDEDEAVDHNSKIESTD